jgi:hypothetical protein
VEAGDDPTPTFNARLPVEQWKRTRIVTYRSKQPMEQNSRIFWRIRAQLHPHLPGPVKRQEIKAGKGNL